MIRLPLALATERPQPVLLGVLDQMQRHPQTWETSVLRHNLGEAIRRVEQEEETQILENTHA